MESIIILIIAAGLGLIPANIAKKKGYSFGLWWFYGWMLFIVAIIHVNLIPDKNAKQIPTHTNSSIPSHSSVFDQRVADGLKKYKKLKDWEIITDEEFKTKKEQLLKLDISTQSAGNIAKEVSSEVEQLRRLYELLDADVITQTEFEAKKKQILGL